MQKLSYKLENRQLSLYLPDTAPLCLMLQPVDDHDAATLDSEIAWITGHTAIPFALAAWKVQNWNADLSPWDAPAVFGNEPFGHGAPEELAFVEQLIPCLTSAYDLPEDTPCVLGGYSLAGLFALWAGCQTSRFQGLAAASPSVWFPGWIPYAQAHATRAACLYLSLGKAEPRTRNQVMAQVGTCIEAQYRLARRDLGAQNCTLEYNEGNHFREPDVRCAKAFTWALEHLFAQTPTGV